jgi:aminoglycoside phosphotransferase (APT) family kinase protein
VIGLSHSAIETALGSHWDAQTNDPTERDDVIQTATWLEPRLAGLADLPRQLIHGDWSPRNLLVSEERPSCITAVLDWQFAAIGPVVFDLAMAASTVLASPSITNKRATVDQLLHDYGADSQRKLLGVAMVAFWFWNYWRIRGVVRREPRSQEELNRQPARLRTVLAFASDWRG